PLSWLDGEVGPSFAGVPRCDAIARSAGHMDVFWIDRNGSVTSTWWDAGTDAGLWDRGRPFQLATQAAQPGAIASVARDAGHMDVFWVAPDGSVMSTWWDQGSTAPPGGWGNPGRAFAIAPAGFAQAGAIASVARDVGH